MYLGLGSNLGNKEENLRKAISMINEQIGTVVRQSAFFYSEPWGYESDNQFVNAVILVETSLSPYDVLTANQRIEHLLGKTQAHATERHSDLSLQSSDLRPPIYHDRPIDIDILLYEISPNLITGVLMQFLVMITLAYASGVFYTVQTMPKTLKKISAALPTGQALRFLQLSARHDSACTEHLIRAAAWTVVFVAVTMLIRRRKLTSKGGA